MLGEDLLAQGGGTVENVLHFLVDDAGGLLGIALGGAEVPADEDAVVGAVVEDGAKAVAHAVAHDHVPGNGAGLLDIPGGAGGDIVQKQLFGHSAAQSHDDAFKHLRLGLEVFQILLGSEQGEAACRAPGDDGDIVHRVHMLQEPAADRVSRLVIGGETAGLFAHLAALLLRAHLDLQDGLVDVLHGDEAVLAAHGQQSRLVHQVFQVSAGKAGGALGNAVQVHVLRQMLVAGVDLQNGLAAPDVGQAHIHLPVETAGTEQGVIQNVGTVGGRHDDDALVAAEAVHLHKQLVQGLLALVMSAAQAAASLAAHGVDLVDEDDGGSHLLGLVKQVADTACAHAHIQLHKVGAGDGQKLNVCLACHSLCQQGLAGARRANQQHALGDAGAHGGIGFRVLQKVHDLRQLFLLFLAAGNVVEGLFVLLLAAQTGAGLAELGHTAACAAALLHHHIPQPHGRADEQQIGQKACPPGDSEALGIIIILDDAVLILLLDQLMEVLIEDGKAVHAVGLFLGQLFPGGRVGLPRSQFQDNVRPLSDEGLDLLLLEQVHKVGIHHRLFLVAPGHGEDRCDQKHNEQNVKAEVAGSVAVGFQKIVTSFSRALCS